MGALGPRYSFAKTRMMPHALLQSARVPLCRQRDGGVNPKPAAAAASMCTYPAGAPMPSHTRNHQPAQGACSATHAPCQHTHTANTSHNTKRLLLLHVAILLRIKPFDITLHTCLICSCFSLKLMPTVFALSASVAMQLSMP